MSTEFSKLCCEPSEFKVPDQVNSEYNINNILIPVKDNFDDVQKNTEYNEYKGDEDNIDDDNDNDDNDNSGWITPSKIP